MENGHDQEQVEELVSVHLVGDRFHGQGTPASALAEVVALDELIRSIARVIWKNKNPHRRRSLRNLDTKTDLRLTSIGGGSKTPVLSRVSQVSDPALFDADPLKPIIDEAVATLIEYVKAAAEGGEIPDVIRQVGGSKMKRLGKSLNQDQYLQIGQPQTSNWEDFPRFTPDARNKVLSRLNAKYKKQIELDGQLKSVDLLNKKATLQSFDRGSIQVSWQDTGISFQVDERIDQSIYCTISGKGEFSPSGQLIKIEEDVQISNLVTTETSERASMLSYFLGKRKLGELKSLDDGWLDGDSGKPLEPDVLEFAERLHSFLLEHEANTQYIFPTENGGIQFEWPESPSKISAEIEFENFELTVYLHRIIDSPPGYEELEFTLDTEADPETEWDSVLREASEWIEVNR
ncbi:hypothetical protein [Rhodococcus sp. BUPNP1]|uniref:hypothetical protein n=1 Tax=Rhodococcus sp. BUPNP1 TaxID=1432786 RepID=UPI00117A3AA5|nr:hypothetical protein [Rhodococcus sp. BUPNP1]